MSPPLQRISCRYTSCAVHKATSSVADRQVILAGEGFLDTSRLACKIGKGEPVSASFTSSSEIRCPDPGPFADETSTLVEATLNGVDYSVDRVVFTHSRKPLVLSVSPAHGPHGGGTSVLLSGANFPDSETLTCSFGELVVPARWLSGRLLQCESPPSYKQGTVVVKVISNTLVLSSEGLAFSFYGTKMLGISPPLGPTGGGTLVSISGEGFVFSPDLMVRFGVADVQATFVSSSQLQCVTPGQLTPENVQVSVATDGVSFDGDSDAVFTYTPPVYIYFVEPAWGFRGGGTTIVLHGKGFTNTAELACSFGESNISSVATFTSSTSISCAVPLGITAGEYDVKLATNGQDVSGNGITFIVLEEPRVLSIDATSGPSWGGETVHVKGVNFEHLSEIGCAFGSTTVDARWESSTSLWCTSPIGSQRDSVGVVVTLEDRWNSSASNMYSLWEPSAQHCTASARGDMYVAAAKPTLPMGTFYDQHYAYMSGQSDFGVSSLESGSISQNNLHAAVGAECRDHSTETAGNSSTGYTAEHLGDLTDSRGVSLGPIATSILRIVPARGSYNGETTVFVAGTNFVNTKNIECMFGASAAPGRWLSPILVACVSPAGNVWETVPFGMTVNGLASSVPPTGIFFNYEGYPTITSIEPLFGPVQGGTLVSIRGEGFTFSSGLRARFGSASVPMTFVNAQELRCISPPSSAGEASVFFGDHDKTFASHQLIFDYTYGPIVSGLHPSRGSLAGGLKVNVSGHNFANSSKLACMFGDVGVVAATFVSDTQIQCETPAVTELAAEELEVSVNGVDFTSDGVIFNFIGTPAVLSSTPDSGSAIGGTVVLVEGVNFVDSAELACRFGSSSVSGRWISSHTIQCRAPVGVPNTTVSLVVSFVEGQTALGDSTFFFFRQPTVHRISDSDGTVQGGSYLSIFGAGFWFSGELRVRFGMTDVPATFMSDSELRCITPVSSPGLSTILISFNGVDFVTRDGLGYTHVAPIRVTSLSPAQGPQAGGTTVAVNGTGFRRDSGLGCMFGKYRVAATYQSGTRVSCVTPQAVNNKTVPVIVVAGATETAAESKDFVYVSGGYVSSVHPACGPVSGGTLIRVEGFSFTDMQELRCVFGTQTVPAVWVSSNQLRCTLPEVSEAQIVEFTVEVSDGQRLGGGAQFSYFAHPTLSSVSPDEGSTDGGTVVNLVGSNFTFSKELRVKFGLVEVPVVFINSTLLRCTTFASSPARVNVSITLNGSDLANQHTLVYTFRSKPRVTKIEPSRGSIAGGTTISVRGDNFNDTTTIACRFGPGGGSLVRAKFVSVEEIMCSSPTVVEVGYYPVEVTVNGVDFSGSGRRFNYHDHPFVTSVSALYGNAKGGAQLLVRGGYFVDSKMITCRFSPSIETSGRWVSSTLIECVPPAADIVSKQGGSATLSIGFNKQDQAKGDYFHAGQRAKFTRLFPSTGSTVGGTTVFLQGDGFYFAGDLRVRFGGVGVPATFLSENVLSCVSPAGEAGVTEVAPMVGTLALTHSTKQFQYVLDAKAASVNTTFDIIGGIATAVMKGDSFVNTSHLACKFGGLAVVPAAFTSASKISCGVPPLSGAGFTSLKVGVDSKKNVLADDRFDYATETPLLTFSPSSGQREGGTLVVMSGGRFSGTEMIECVFDWISVPAVWLSEEVIQCKSPVWEKEETQVHVTVVINNEGVGRGLFTYTRTFVDYVIPEEGDRSGGTLVTISGSGFDSGKQWFCWFGLEKTPAVVADEEGKLLQCLSPPWAGPGSSIDVNVAAGSSLPGFQPSVPFTYIPSVEALVLDPASGSVLGGTSVVVTIQHGFGGYRPPVHCDFGDVGSSQSTWLNATAVICLAPPSPYRGKVLVSVHPITSKNQVGKTTPFWYFYPPTVSFVYPLEVVASNDTSAVLTVTGGNFVGSGPLSCRIDQLVERALWISGSIISCPLSNIRPGKHTIEISNNMVDFVPASERLVVSPRGTLAESAGYVTPSRGSTEGGTSVEVLGLDVEQLGSVRRCVLGDIVVNGSSPSVDRVVCVTEHHEEATVPVTVCDSHSSCSPIQGYFSFVEFPVLTALSSSLGSIHGESVITVDLLKGCGYVNKGVWCKVGSTPLRASSVGEASVTCVMPSQQDGIVHVSVSCNGLDFSNPLPFRYYPEIVVYDIYPLSVSSDGESMVHISGRGFQNSANGDSGEIDVLCIFDETPTPAIWVSDVLALCRRPLRAPGLVELRILASVDQELLAVTNITYVDDTLRTENYVLNPTAGSIGGGAVVSIFGKHMVATPLVCSFGAQTTSPVYVSSSEVACAAPASIALGRVKVTLTFLDYEEVVGEFEYREYLQLESVHPAVADVDGGTSVTIVLKQKSESISGMTNLTCNIGGVNVPALIHLSSSSVTCIAPALPYGVASIFLADGGQDVSRGDFTLRYVPLPVIVKISPAGGRSSGGGDVIVYGHNLVYSPDLVCLFGGTLAPYVEWLSSTQLRCTAPKLLPGIVKVAVSLDGVRFSTVLNTTTYVVHRDMGLTRLDPQAGYVEGGTMVTVKGNSFPATGGLECLFGTIVVPATVLNPTSLECLSPSLGVGTVDVRVQHLARMEEVDSGGIRAQFQVTSFEPTIQYISPKFGPIEGGAVLAIIGTKFPVGSQIVCRFKGRLEVVDTTADFLTPSTVMCISPRWHQPEQAVAVDVLIGGKMVRSASDSRMLIDFGVSPVIESLHPRLGPASGGTVLHLRGANFQNLETLACLICTSSVEKCIMIPAEWLSPSELTCITPGHEPGPTKVRVTNNGLDGDKSFSAQFFFVSTPRITSVNPNRGGVEGGTKVLIRGTNLAITTTFTCRFGEISTKATFHSSGVLCTSPRVLNAQKVVIELSINGVDFTSDGQKFEYSTLGADIWSAEIHPSYGDRRGGTQVIVHVGGSNDSETPLEGGYECLFDDEAIPAFTASLSSVMCRSPGFLEEGVVILRLKSEDGTTWTASTLFEVLPIIDIYTLEPASGWASGGDSVVIHGSGFVDTLLVCCRFGDRTAPAELLSASTLRCRTPARLDESSSSVLVEVSHNCDDFYGEGLEFQYHDDFLQNRDAAADYPEQLLRCSPDDSSRTKDQSLTCVSLAGSSYLHQLRQLESIATETALVQSEPQQLSVRSGPIAGGTSIVVSGLKHGEDIFFCRFAGGGKVVVADALPSAQAGSITCLSPPWSAPGTVSMQVTDADTGLRHASTFLYYLQPILYGMTPSWGNELGRTMIKLSASGISGAQNPTCGFFDANNTLLAASTAVWVGNNDMWCQSPTYAPGLFLIEISANGADFTGDSGLLFTIAREPIIFDVAPLIGVSDGGTEITVRGTSFGHMSEALCRFAEASVPATVVNDYMILCTSPPISRNLGGTSHVVDFALVVNEEDTRYSSVSIPNFTYMAYPKVVTISPKTGPTAGGTLVNVTGDNFIDVGDGVECWFGEARKRATVVAVDRLVCESPPYPEGAVTVEVRNDRGGADLSQTGPFFVYNSSLRVSGISAAASTSIDSTPRGIERDGDPFTTILDSSNTLLEVTATHHTMCTVNSETVSPNTEGTGCFSEEARVGFIAPDNGPRAGETPVVVTGRYFSINAVFMCHFGTRQTRGHVVDASHLVCSSPPSSVHRSVDFHVTSDGKPLLSEEMLYFYEDVPTITRVRPRLVYQGDSTTDIVVEGEGFRNDSLLACMLGGVSVVRGTFLSDKSATCTVAQNSSGYVRLELANNGMDFSSNGHGVVIAPQPVVTGIDPAAASSLSDAGVLVSGLHFMDVPDLACVFGQQMILAEWVSREKVHCRMPASRMPSLMEVSVTLVRQQNDQGVVNFEDVSSRSVQVKSVRPQFGACDGGTVVTVAGSNLRSEGDTTCRFSGAGDVLAQVVDNSTVQCVAPASLAGQARIQIATSSEDFSTTFAAFTYLVRPTVASLHPSAGILHGGTHVTVIGSGFANTTDLECFFGNQPALSVAFVSPEEAMCESPPSGAPTVIPVTVRLNGVVSTPDVSYRYVLPPTVIDVSPREIYFNESRWLTVTGANFAPSSDLICLFDGVIAETASWLSPSLLRCPIPITLTPVSSPVSITVTNTGDDMSAPAATFYMFPRPTIHSVSPTSGFLNRTTPVVVLVKSYGRQVQHDTVPGQARCLFDDESVQAIAALASTEQCDKQTGESQIVCIEVRCTAPAHRARRNAYLRIVSGTGAAPTNAIIFEFNTASTAYSLLPGQGPYGGGTAVTIQHRLEEMPALPVMARCHFSDAFDTIYVTGEASEAESGFLSVMCYSPPWRSHSGHQSLVKVKLMVDGFLDNGDENLFIYSNGLQIFALSPQWGSDRGGAEILIRGLGFDPHVQFLCTFAQEMTRPVLAVADHTSSTPAVWLSEEEVLCESPAHPPGLAYVTVTADGEQAGGVLQFQFRSPPRFNLLSPHEGPSSGGTVVDVSGENIFFTDRTVCRFGGLHNSATIYVHSRSLLCISPRASPGVYPVSIAMDGDRFEETGLSFHYLEDIRIMSLAPSYGWTPGGTNVTLRVDGIQSYAQSVQLLCVFGINREVAVSVDVEAGSVVCSSPPAAQTSLVASDVTVATVSVVASSGAVPTASAQIFSYVAPVTVTAAIPDSGRQGTLVHVFGENYDESFELECQFGTHNTPATFVTSQRVDCYAPTKGSGQVGVTILSGGKLPAWHTSAFFTFEQPVVLLSINPRSGKYGASTTVTVAGQGFRPSSNLKCQFGELEESATFLNSTHVSCVAPSQGADDVPVSILQEDSISFNVLRFRYRAEIMTPPLVPSEGSLFGGTLVSIKSNVSSTMTGLRCTFTSREALRASSAAEADGDNVLCETPPSPGLRVGTVWMSLTTGGITVAEGAEFTFVNPPVVRTIHPRSSYIQAGERLFVFGDNFASSNELACKFASTINNVSVTVSARYISRAKISCITPVWQMPADIGTQFSVHVTTNGIDFTSGGPQLTFHPATTISTVMPSAGSNTGGTVVTVSGVALPTENLACRFGVLLVSAWVTSRGQAVCISPPSPHEHVGSVPLHLTVDGREVTSTAAEFIYIAATTRADTVAGVARTAIQKSTKTTLADERVLDGWGALAGLPSGPAINRLEPNGCSTSGAVEILVHGSKFISSPSLTCSFGGVHLEAIFVSVDLVRCMAPRHMPARVFLEVSNDGMEFSASGVAFTFHAEPSVCGIEPDHGPAEGSTPVTVIGNQFRRSSDLSCQFGDTAVPGLFLSSNQIKCWTPPMEGIGTTIQVKVRHLQLALTVEHLC